MIYSYDLTGAAQLIRNVPLFGNATDIAQGAAVMRGSTAGTNTGYGIVAASTINTFLGVTESLFNADTLDNDPGAGVKYILTPVTINPFAVYECEYSQTTGLSVASVSSGNPTVTSLEAIDGGWILVVGAPALGYLSYVKSVSGGAATLKTPNTAITSSSKVIKILPLYDDNVDLTTDATKIIGTTAAQGTGLIRVLENKVVAPGFDHQYLDPTKHDAITFASGFKFFAMINFETSIYNSTN